VYAAVCAIASGGGVADATAALRVMFQRRVVLHVLLRMTECVVRAFMSLACVALCKRLDRSLSCAKEEAGGKVKREGSETKGMAARHAFIHERHEQ
jgi:hypothetical protein